MNTQTKQQTGEGNAPRFPKYLCDNEKAAGGRMIRAEYPDAGVPELQQRFNDALNAYENIETKDSFCTFLGKFWLTGEGMRQAKAPQHSPLPELLERFAHGVGRCQREMESDAHAAIIAEYERVKAERDDLQQGFEQQYRKVCKTEAQRDELLAACKEAMRWLQKANSTSVFQNCALPLGGVQAEKKLASAIRHVGQAERISKAEQTLNN